MSSFLWPNDDGWPYPDPGPELAAVDISDDDVLSLQLSRATLLAHLDPLERQVVAARYGLGEPERTMKELHHELGLPRDELRSALGSGLAKLRIELSG
jgi:DNA-directed RNA polymerase sigma subunit (sigma70/sigma32)